MQRDRLPVTLFVGRGLMGGGEREEETKREDNSEPPNDPRWPEVPQKPDPPRGGDTPTRRYPRSDLTRVTDVSSSASRVMSSVRNMRTEPQAKGGSS